MDEAYKQHHARRKNRSTTNLNHLTLAPLTTKLPLEDDADFTFAPPPHTTSYLQGKSAPTTPRLLSQAPSHAFRSASREPRRASVPHSGLGLSKSRSASHLAFPGPDADDNESASGPGRPRKAVSGAGTPTRRRGGPIPRDDSDWLLRAGILMSSEAREYKGQAWLTSRESSTSLAGMRDEGADDVDLVERELARERELAARYENRRGSAIDPTAEEGYRSARASRRGSRAPSRAASRGQLLTPRDGGRRHSEDEYFGAGAVGDGDYAVQGPDFVDLDDQLEATGQDTSVEDEAAVRKLVRAESAGGGSWFGWSLFSVAENQEDTDEEDEYEAARDMDEKLNGWRSSTRHFEGVTNTPAEHIPPPDPNRGGWQDAAWLLSVASKVIL